MSSTPSRRRPGELVFALVLVVFSLAAFWEAYKISGFSGASTPGIFPMLAAATMIVSGFTIFRRTAAQQRGDHPASERTRFFREIAPTRHLIMIGLIFLYVVAMPVLGFMISAGIFLFAAFVYLRRKNILVSLALTAGSLAAIFFVFRVMFEVVLPTGTLVRYSF